MSTPDPGNRDLRAALNDLDGARNWMASICGPHGLQVSHPERLRFHQSGTVLRSMATTIGYVEYGTDVTVAVSESSPLNCYSVSLPMVGQQELAAHGKRWLSDQDCGLIVSPQESQDLAITGNCRKLHVAIPRSALQQVLQTMLQRPVETPLVFQPDMSPVFDPHAMTLLAPIAVILVAENLGHIKAVSAMTGQNLDRYIGRAFLGDALATIVSGFAGGTGVTTYAENIGVMAVTKIYSTLVFVIAALIALVLGFSPKFGAVIQTIPGPVLGGVSIVVFGLIAVTGARIWVVNKVDFSDNRNLIVAAVTLVLGAGDFSLKLGGFGLGGIGTATFGAIILYALLRRKPTQGPVA